MWVGHVPLKPAIPSVSVLQCTTVYCRLLQITAVYCSVLQCTAVYCSVLQCTTDYCSVLQCSADYCSVLNCTAVYCSVLQITAVYCSVLQITAVYYRLLQCTAVFCRLLQKSDLNFSLGSETNVYKMYKWNESKPWNSNFRSLYLCNLKIWYFKIRIFDLTRVTVWNIKFYYTSGCRDLGIWKSGRHPDRQAKFIYRLSSCLCGLEII